MKFFNEQDFITGRNNLETSLVTRELLADKANEKLLKEGLVVTGNIAENGSWFMKSFTGPTHKALLINIEPIEACKHVGEFQFAKITNDGPEYLVANCRNCSKNFKLVAYDP